MTDISIQLKAIQIENPEALNMILGQTTLLQGGPSRTSTRRW